MTLFLDMPPLDRLEIFKKITPLDFGPIILHTKSSYPFSKRNSVNTFISVLLVAFLLEFKGSRQKRLSGFFPLRGGVPPISTKGFWAG